MTQDSIKIQILADGTLKIITDPVSPANHKNADELLDFITKLAGGTVQRERRPDAKGHTHQHGGVWHTH